jgi:hypothetical protein
MQAVKEFVTAVKLVYSDTYAITNLSIERELTENIDTMAYQIPVSVVVGRNVFYCTSDILWCIHLFFLYIVCSPLLCLCRPFCISERCLDSNPESCRSKQAR